MSYSLSLDIYMHVYISIMSIVGIGPCLALDGVTCSSLGGGAQHLWAILVFFSNMLFVIRIESENDPLDGWEQQLLAYRRGPSTPTAISSSSL